MYQYYGNRYGPPKYDHRVSGSCLGYYPYYYYTPSHGQVVAHNPDTTDDIVQLIQNVSTLPPELQVHTLQYLLNDVIHGLRGCVEQSHTYFYYELARPNDDCGVILYGPDGELLYGGEIEGVNIWEILTRNLFRETYVQSGVRDFALTPDGQFLAIATNSTRLYIVNTGMDTKETIINMPRASHQILRETTAVAYSPDGKFIAIGTVGVNSEQDFITVGGYAGVYIIDTATNEIVSTLIENGSEVTTIAYSPNGWYVAAGMSDGTVYVWNAVLNEVFLTFQNEGLVNDVAFSPQGGFLAAGFSSGNITIWNMDTGNVWASSNSDSPVITIAYRPTGNYLAFGLENGDCYFWNLVSNTKVLLQTQFIAKHVLCVAFSPDGRFLAESLSPNRVIIWDLEIPEYKTIDIIPNLGPEQLFLLYSLYRIHVDPTLPSPIPLPAIEEALKLKYGKPIPAILKLTVNFRQLPEGLKDVLEECFDIEELPPLSPAYEALGLFTNTPTPYEVLRIRPGATWDQVRFAYNKLSSFWSLTQKDHPHSKEVLSVLSNAYKELLRLYHPREDQFEPGAKRSNYPSNAWSRRPRFY